MPAPTFSDLFQTFYGLLESLEVEYFAYGGVVVAVWGAPRETVDVDAMACVADDDIEDLLLALATAGRCPGSSRTSSGAFGLERVRSRSPHSTVSPSVSLQIEPSWGWRFTDDARAGLRWPPGARSSTS